MAKISRPSKIKEKKLLKQTKNKESKTLSFSKPISYIDKFKKNRKFRFLFFATILLIAGLIYLFINGYIIAASVNGKPISRIELVKQLEKEAGKEALENLITRKLVVTQAGKQGVVVSESDIDAEIDKIRKQVEENGSDLETELSYQGQSVESLRNNLHIKLIAERLFSEKLLVNDEDTKKYYEDYKERYVDTKYEDVKEQIKNNISNERLSTEFQNWLTGLRDTAKIKYFTNL